MSGKKAAAIALMIVALAIMGTTVHALGIAPAKKTVKFEPNKTINLTYRVYNSEGAKTSVKVQLGGALQGIARAEPETIEFGEGILVKILNIQIRFGERPPEERTGSVTLANANQNGGIGAGLKISAQVEIEADANNKITEITGAATAASESEEKDTKENKPESEEKKEKPWKTWILAAALVTLLGANAIMITRKKPTDRKEEQQQNQNAEQPTTEEAQAPAQAQQKTTEDPEIEEIEREIEQLKSI